MVLEFLNSFVEQSQRVISITYKPKPMEYKQMALTTAVGMVVVGIIGFVISIIATLLRG